MVGRHGTTGEPTIARGNVCRKQRKDDSRVGPRRQWITYLIALPLLSGCMTLTVEPRAVVSGADQIVRVMTLECDAADRVIRGRGNDAAADALGERYIRVLIWNVHKEGDPGWQRDLAAFASASDVMLLQETALRPSLRQILDTAGLRWVMASSFMFGDEDIGVLTATRVAPLASCTRRVVEPLLRIPKSAVMIWLPIAGSPEALAIVNVHAINFDIALDAYRAQLEAVADAIAGHRGPVILAGDFNTWSDARDRVVAEMAARLGLGELEFKVDRRSTFLGRHVDHIFVRGLSLVDIRAIQVTSSDHNPMEVTLQIRD
jgi:endonuclease/exonuclease/phosphatase (EEP) superfamily protein YafD